MMKFGRTLLALIALLTVAGAVMPAHAEGYYHHRRHHRRHWHHR